MKKAGIIFLILIILITFSIKVADLTGPVNGSKDQNILVEIKKGFTAQEIVNTLYIHNLIQSRLVFKTYLYLAKIQNDLQAGYYYLTPAMDMFEIAERLTKGGNAVFKITIPEGFTVLNVINRLSEKSKNDKESYLKVIKDQEFDYSFLPEKSRDLLYRLEGYLFPDTYTIPLGFDSKQTIDVLLKSFKRNIIEKLMILKDSKYTIHQLITIASLVEKEAKFDDEKPIIASVIFNRLEQDMLLQIDASVQYLLEEKKQQLLYKDLEIDSLYNTYLYKGLPPGPICNPGDKSIQAVLEPSETKYLFYFALENGRHIFTKSYQEHLNKQQEVKRGKDNG